MKLSELVKISRESLKVMSAFDIKPDYWRYVDLYEDYQRMRAKREKFRYIIAVLSERYGISESTVKRIIRRLSVEVVL